VKALGKTHKVEMVGTLFWIGGFDRFNIHSILEHQLSSVLSFNVGVKNIVSHGDGVSFSLGFLFGIDLQFLFNFLFSFLLNFLFDLLFNFLFIFCLLTILLLKSNSLNTAGA